MRTATSSGPRRSGTAAHHRSVEAGEVRVDGDLGEAVALEDRTDGRTLGMADLEDECATGGQPLGGTFGDVLVVLGADGPGDQRIRRSHPVSLIIRTPDRNPAALDYASGRK